MESKKDSKKDLVLLFFGGGMAGTFGNGVATVLQNSGLMDRVYAGYGSSAGFFALEYLWCNQIELGSSIYWEDLNGKKFINYSHLYKHIKSILDGSANKDKMYCPPIYNIDHVHMVMEKKKPLDMKNFSDAPLFALAINEETLQHEWLDVQNNKEKILDITRATGGAQPGYVERIPFKGKYYLDGDLIKNQHILEEIAHKHSDKKIICVINHNLNKNNSVGLIITNFLTYFLAGKLYGKKFKDIIARGSLEKEYIEIVRREHQNFYVLNSQYFGETACTDPKKLKKIYKSGIKAMKKLLPKLV